VTHNTYELFTRVRIRGTFSRQDTGTTIDPTTVELFVQQPDGVIVSYSYDTGDVVRDDQGIYHYDAELAMAGRWRYKWEGAGTVECGSPDTALWVNHSHFVGSRWPTGALLAGYGAFVIDSVGVNKV
jgi:hypothetical protein